MQCYHQISRQEFEEYIFSQYKAYPVHWSFYKYEWKPLHTECREVPRKEIHEYVYIIQTTAIYGILVYSSIDMSSRESRSVGGDAIRLVPVELYYFKPIRKKEHRVNRITSWKQNFEKRVNQIRKKLPVK